MTAIAFISPFNRSGIKSFTHGLHGRPPLKNVDGGLEKGGHKWAVEIELTDANLMVNVEKDAATCDKIIICAKSE